MLSLSEQRPGFDFGRLNHHKMLVKVLVLFRNDLPTIVQSHCKMVSLWEQRPGFDFG